MGMLQRVDDSYNWCDYLDDRIGPCARDPEPLVQMAEAHAEECSQTLSQRGAARRRRDLSRLHTPASVQCHRTAHVLQQL